jgi:hypothetical protein
MKPESVPNRVAQALRGFRFKRLQREDYARAALHDGMVLAHDTGCGKTLALFVWPALKVGFQTEFAPGEKRRLKPLEPVLLVVPGNLHKQVADEGMEKFHTRVIPLESQEAFIQLSTFNPQRGTRELAPGYFITSYTQLTGNGVTPFPDFDRANIIGMMQTLGLTDSDSSEFFDCRAETCAKHYRRLDALDSMTLPELQSAWAARKSQYADNEALLDEFSNSYHTLAVFHCDKPSPSFSDLPPEKKQTIRSLMTENRYGDYTQSVGESRWFGAPASSTAAPLDVERSMLDVGCLPRGNEVPLRGSPKPSSFKIKCVYSPSLADLCQDSFGACAADEGVKMKGEDTIIGTGVRQINARFKLVLTATPIKNRLPDVFRLAWWSTGARAEAHARFPYPDSSAARDEFASEFLISERNLSKEKESHSKSQRYKKLTPQVCNVHRLWKMFAPIILRRRKADFGEDIVPKLRQVVRVPMGAEQAAVYRYHLKARYTDKNGKPAIGAQLQALRIAAANAASELLVRPCGDGTKGQPRSRTAYIPKLHAALKLIHQCLERGEQAIVFSAFHDSLDALSARLAEAGVAHCVADGRISQKRCASLAAQFKLGPGKSPWPVMLAGVDCMSEGHSFNLCNNVILLCYSWAYDKFEQGINRVHRLNSPWPVNVYPIICDRSIDRKLEAMIQEKGDAAELVLDGRLQAEQSTEVNLAALLEIARKEFDAGAKLETVDENDLQNEWPPLRAQLSVAASEWRVKGFNLLGGESCAGIELLPVEPVDDKVTSRILPANLVSVQQAARFNPTRRAVPHCGTAPKRSEGGPATSTDSDLLLWQLAADN